MRFPTRPICGRPGQLPHQSGQKRLSGSLLFTRRPAPSIRRKSEVIWSGTLARGGMVPVQGSNGWVHLTFQDMTQEDPRTENDDNV
jgi:hypothetical protein